MTICSNCRFRHDSKIKEGWASCRHPSFLNVQNQAALEHMVGNTMPPDVIKTLCKKEFSIEFNVDSTFPQDWPIAFPDIIVEKCEGYIGKHNN